MLKNRKPRIGILLGDHAGIGPEITAKLLSKTKKDFIPIVIGNEKIFNTVMQKYVPSFTGEIVDFLKETDESIENTVYIVNVDAGDIQNGMVSAASGQLSIDAASIAAEYKRKGFIDGILMAPNTNMSMQKANKDICDDKALLNKVFGVDSCNRVVKHADVIRAAVVGPCAFKDVFDQITQENIIKTSDYLLEAMDMFKMRDRGIAISALNPHAGDGGLFGTEESDLLLPTVKEIQKKYPDVKVIGPYASDSVLIRAIKGEFGGIVYLHINQAEIAMTTWAYHEEVVVFTGVSCSITSTEHRSALEIAGKGIADEKNLACALEDLLKMIANIA